MTTANQKETKQEATTHDEMTTYCQASLWSKLTFGWGTKYLEMAARKEKFTLESFGDVPEHMKSAPLATIIEDNYAKSGNLYWALTLSLKGKSFISIILIFSNRQNLLGRCSMHFREML